MCAASAGEIGLGLGFGLSDGGVCRELILVARSARGIYSKGILAASAVIRKTQVKYG